MQQGTTVIRKADLEQLRPIYGTVAEMLPNNRVKVAWRHTRRGLVSVSNGRANATTVKASTLVEVTTEMSLAIAIAVKERNAEYRKRMEAERPYICEKDGSLRAQQTRDGKCCYCGATVTMKEQEG